MRRTIALFFPLLSADRWLRNGGAATEPFVFVEKQKGAMRIVALDDQALALGLRAGMMLADARARVPDLAAHPYDPAGDEALLTEIAEDCDRYTPMVALDLPDGLLLDITGCTPIWGDERELVSTLAARLAHHGFTLRLAVAETPDKARAMARYGQELLSVNRQTLPNQLNEERTAYHPPLPVEALELSDTQTTALKRAGLYSIDDLAARPRAPLAARFGKAMVDKLARVLGEEDIRITPHRPVPPLFLVWRYAEPVAHQDYVLQSVRDLMEDASVALRERGEGGRRFILSLFRSDGDTRRLVIETGQPTRDPLVLDRLLRERMESLADPLDPGFGYDALRLDVARTTPLGASQSGFDRATPEAGTGDSAGIDTLTDQLGVRLGRDRIRRFAPGNSHIPETASFTYPASTPPFPADWPAPEVGDPPLRPLRLFDPPYRIEAVAEVPDGPPRRFRWRRQTYTVVNHEGPERIAAEWWRRRDMKGLTRDYFRVEDSEGQRFWLFRHGLYGAEKTNPDWYLHGVFV